MHKGWMALVALAGLGAAQARAQADVPVSEFHWLERLEDAAHEDVLEPLAAELAGSPQARFQLSAGRSPTQRGFALDIAGGVPHGWAQLTFEAEGAGAAQGLVRLDSNGAARLVRRNWHSTRSVSAACALPQLGGGVARLNLRIPAASALPPSQSIAASLGDIVITEVMKDPTAVSDASGEWFEIRNRTNAPINLEGWLLTDAGSNSHTIQSAGGTGVWVGARSYFVLGINANPLTNGGVQVDYKYSNFTLANGADAILLYDAAGTLTDSVLYDDGIFWPDTPGKSLSLDRALVDPVSNDDGAHWCDALYPLSASNTDCASPRRANSVCP